MPPGIGYGMVPGRMSPGQLDPLDGFSVTPPGAGVPPPPPPAPGFEAQPGMMTPPAPFAPPPPGGAPMAPGQGGLAADPQLAQMLQGKSPEELAALVMKVREFNARGGAPQQ